MGDTISSLVFRPPPPTPIHPSDLFYLDVDVHSPLCTTNQIGKSSRYRRFASSGGGRNGCRGGCVGHFDNDDDDDEAKTNHSTTGSGCFGGGSTMCLDSNGESDLASLDANYLTKNKKKNDQHHRRCLRGRCSPSSMDIDHQNNCQNNNTNTNANALDDDKNNAVPMNVRNGQVYKIPAFFIRRRNATQTILFSHGNAEDLGMMYPRMKDLAIVLGVNILAYEYTGYGLSIPGPTTRGKNDGSRSEGDDRISNEGPSENMIYRNVEAAYRYLTEDRKIPPQQIVLYGRSLGSGPSCYLAAKTALSGNSVGGLVLHSPFLSVYKVVADLNGLDMSLVGDLFHNERRARNIRCPTLIIHGREDEVVPFWHAPRLLATIPPEYRARPLYVHGMGHNHIESQCRDRYFNAMISFLKFGAQNGYGESGGGLMRASAQQDKTRGGAMETKENNHPSFYINTTWVRHAKVLLKEVLFSDLGGMCHVNQKSVSHEDNDGHWKESTTSRSSGSENEFSPWTSVGTIRSNQSPRNVQQEHQQQQQRRGHEQLEKILTPRSNGTNTPRVVTPRGSPKYYHKAQSMKPTFVDKGLQKSHQQQIRRFRKSDVKISSPRAQQHASSRQRVTLSRERSYQRLSHAD